MNSSFITKIFTIVTLLVTLNFSFCKSEIVNLEKKDYAVDFNVTYYRENTLNVYYDKDKIHKKTPVVIYVHGGGMCEGSKEEELNFGYLLQENGYIAVIPDYRLHPTVHTVDDIVEDIFNAIQWTFKNIRKYGGDVSNMTLAGQSAGAHLISLTLLKCALNMKVNDIQLHPMKEFKHLLVLNGPYTFEKGEALKNTIDGLRFAAANVPGLGFLEAYANVKEELLLNKTGYDEVDILAQVPDKSIQSFGAKKITFIEGEEDTTVVLGTADPMVEQVERTVKNVEIVHDVLPGDHNYLINGVRRGDEELGKVFIKYVNSGYQN